MSKELIKLELSEFTAKNTGKSRIPSQTQSPQSQRGSQVRVRQQPRKKEKQIPEYEDKKIASMLIKIGVCAGVCALALALKLIDIPVTKEVVANVKQAITDQVTLDETLGKLKFVQLPDVAAVFGEQKPELAMPVNGKLTAADSKTSQGVEIKASEGTQVIAAADGIVEAVGKDEQLGEYVRIKHNSELETLIYGLSDISVEKGQQLSKKDTIGKVGSTGKVYFEVRLAGKPMDPMDYLADVSKN